MKATIRVPEFAEVKTRTIFDFLVDSYIQDHGVKDLNPGSSGWRTLGDLAKNVGLARSTLYGKIGGQVGSTPAIRELVSSHLVIAKSFPGERGRGGEVTRFRINYDRDEVRNYVQELSDMKARVLK